MWENTIRISLGGRAMNAVCMNVGDYKKQLTFMKEYPIVETDGEFIYITNDESILQRFHESRFRIEKEDEINKPSHYTRGKIEVIDFIEDQSLNFSRGAAIKYICRAGFKGENTEVKDLKKAAWFINREIERLENNEHVETN